MSKDRDKAADTARAAFKFSLIETVNADPQMKPNDLKLICAMANFMTWPKREAWLVVARARAMTKLSESEVSRSRSRLQERGYLSEPKKQGRTNVYTIENPHLEAIRDHVALYTEWHRERSADRVAKYRQKPKIAPPQSVTETALLHHPEERYITPPESVYSVATVEEGALRDAPTSQGRALQPPPHAGGHVPFPVPGNEDELEATLSAFKGLSPAVVGFFRLKLMAGQLTPAMVEEQRRLAS